MLYLRSQDKIFRLVELSDLGKKMEEDCSYSSDIMVALPSKMLAFEKNSFQETKSLKEDDYLLIGPAQFHSEENYLAVSQRFFHQLKSGSTIAVVNSSLRLKVEKKDLNFALCQVKKQGSLDPGLILYLQEQMKAYLYAVEYAIAKRCQHFLLDYEHLADLSFLLMRELNQYVKVNWALKIEHASLKNLRQSEKQLCDYLWVDGQGSDESFFPEQFLHEISEPCPKQTNLYSPLYLSIMKSIEYCQKAKQFSRIALKHPPEECIAVLKAQYPEKQLIIYHPSQHDSDENQDFIHRWIPPDLDFLSRVSYVEKDLARNSELLYLEIDEKTDQFTLVWID